VSFQEDLSRARWDGQFFAKRFLGVDLHPGQIRLFDIYLARQNTSTWWVAAFLTICLSAGNRAGKTMIMAIVVIHACLFKMGQRPPATEAEADQWQRAPYHWYHFAIQQEVADLLFNEVTNLLQGIHVAQKEGYCPLAREITENGGATVATWDKKEFGEYQLIVFEAILGGAQIHFRTTAGGKGRGALGRDMHGISFDEAGLEANLTWIMDNVIHLRRLGTGGQVFLFSTPEEGLTDFADLWFRGDPDQPDRRPRWMSMRMSTRDNIGFGLDSEMFEALTADMGEDHIKQNIDGYFIQGRTAYFNYQSVDAAFVDELPMLQAAKNGHNYVQGVDPALTLDSLWSIVGDVFMVDVKDQNGVMQPTPHILGVAVQRLRGKKTTPAIVELAQSVHFSYDRQRPGFRSYCSTAIDATGFGGHMFRDELNEGIPGGVRAIEFGGTTGRKRKLLGDLRTWLDTGRLRMPRQGFWLEVRRQLLGYKLDDKKIEQDAVMALAVLVAEARRSPAGDVGSADFDLTAVGY